MLPLLVFVPSNCPYDVVPVHILALIVWRTDNGRAYIFPSGTLWSTYGQHTLTELLNQVRAS